MGRFGDELPSGGGPDASGDREVPVDSGEDFGPALPPGSIATPVGTMVPATWQPFVYGAAAVVGLLLLSFLVGRKTS